MTRSVTVLERLIDAVPSGSQIVLCGRSVPPIHFTRRLLAGDAAEIGRAELAFSDAEARAVAGSALADIDDTLLERLVSMIEGWPAGIHLAVLALHGHPDPERAVLALGANDRRLADYFHEELLQYLPETVRRFLVRTSVLERLSGPLCDAVLGETGSAEVLERLAASENHFVVGFDGEPEWYRYHHLFADLLVAELRRTAPGEESVSHRRAASWLSRHGFADAAVHHAQLVGDDAFAAEVLYQQVVATIRRGTLASLEHWWRGSPPPPSSSTPCSPWPAGWLDLTQGRPAGVEHWLEMLESLTYDGPLPDGTSSLAVAVAALRMTSGIGGVKQTAESARTVKEAGARGQSLVGAGVAARGHCPLRRRRESTIRSRPTRSPRSVLAASRPRTSWPSPILRLPASGMTTASAARRWRERREKSCGSKAWTPTACSAWSTASRPTPRPGAARPLTPPRLRAEPKRCSAR